MLGRPQVDRIQNAFSEKAGQMKKTCRQEEEKALELKKP